jgi:hypothetical protein
MNNTQIAEDLYFRLNQIKDAYGLVATKRGRKADLVRWKMDIEIDKLIDRLESLYYRYFLKKENVNRIENEIERNIVETRENIRNILPLLMMMQYGSEEPAQAINAE